MTSNLFTTEEVAGYLRVDVMTIYRLAKDGRIPASKVGHQWRFDKEEINEWFKNGHSNNGSNNNKNNIAQG